MICALGGIQALRKLEPDAEIHFVGPAKRITILENHPDLAGLHDAIDTLPSETVCVDIATPYPENVEHDPLTGHLDRTSIFAFKMGVATPEIPRLYLTKPELDEAFEWLRDRGYTNPLCLAWRSAAAYKNYPQVEKLYWKLSQKRPVLVLEHALQLPIPTTRGLSYRQHAAIIAHACMVVTPDSGPLHMAGALGRPIFGLYGSQSPYTRQVPYRVPGGWIQGSCPYGKYLCRERVCGDPFGTPPCMNFFPDAAAARILETLAAIKLTWPGV